jgi:hypothetical protein
MPVGMIFDSGQTYAGRAYRDAMAAAGSHHVPVVLARRGMQWTSGDGVTLEVLAPSMPFLADTGDDVNENSIVVMLRADGFRELFMGDAGEASEARLLAAGIDLHADAVKVGSSEERRHQQSFAPLVELNIIVENKQMVMTLTNLGAGLALAVHCEVVVHGVIYELHCEPGLDRSDFHPQLRCHHHL